MGNQTFLGKIFSYGSVFLYSVLLFIEQTTEIVEDMLELCLETSELTAANLYYLCAQVNAIIFQNNMLQTPKIKLLSWRLFEKSIQQYKKLINIPQKENRIQKDFIVVLTDQFTNVSHGPTKTALDRCQALMKNGKKVILINTGEYRLSQGKIPLMFSYQWLTNNDLIEKIM